MHTMKQPGISQTLSAVFPAEHSLQTFQPRILGLEALSHKKA